MRADTDLGINRVGNAILCYAAGESDRPCVRIARTAVEVEQFIIDEWLGDPESAELPEIMQEIAKHDWREDGSKRWEFEIGSVEFSDIFATGEELAAFSASRTSVPAEPTYEMVQAGAKLVKENLPYHTGTKAIYKAMVAAAPEPAGERVTYTPEQLLDAARNTLLPTQFDKRMAVVELIQALEKPDTGERPLHPPELKMLNDIRAELGIAKLTAEPAAQPAEVANHCSVSYPHPQHDYCDGNPDGISLSAVLAAGGRITAIGVQGSEHPKAEVARADEGVCGCTQESNCRVDWKSASGTPRCRIAAGKPFATKTSAPQTPEQDQ